MPSTRLAISGTRWLLNGNVTYSGASAEGLLMNVRMVNATFEDRGEDPGLNDFDPDANADSFIAAIPDYAEHGVLAFTLCLQGGAPGYEGALNSAFNSDGTLRESYMARVGRVIEACDRSGVAVILGFFYQRQMGIFEGLEGVRAGVVNAVRWIAEQEYEHVAVEIANEHAHHGFVDHPIIKTAEGQVELIHLAKDTGRSVAPDLLITTSGMGSGKVADEIAEVADFVIIHYNNTDMKDVPDRIDALRGFGKPIVCNEDTKTGKRGAEVASLCVANNCSWGLMQLKVNQQVPFQFNGAEDDPEVYGRLKELTRGK